MKIIRSGCIKAVLYKSTVLAVFAYYDSRHWFNRLDWYGQKHGSKAICRARLFD